MALSHSPKTVKDGLVLSSDTANPKSYLGSGTVIKNMITEISGEVVNSPTYSTSLKGYFSFVTDDYLRFPNDTALDLQTYSVEVFARTNATTQNGFWFEKGTVNSQYSLFQESSSIIWRANIGGIGTSNMIMLNTSSFINTTDWFHIVGTFTSGSQKIYINGVERGSNTLTGTISTNSGGMSVGVYGGFSGGRGYYYNGDIAVVKVYNKVLSETEIKQNFNAIKGRFGL